MHFDFRLAQYRNPNLANYPFPTKQGGPGKDASISKNYGFEIVIYPIDLYGYFYSIFEKIDEFYKIFLSYTFICYNYSYHTRVMCPRIKEIGENHASCKINSSLSNEFRLGLIPFIGP
jgi:hypothetical protein